MRTIIWIELFGEKSLKFDTYAIAIKLTDQTVPCLRVSLLSQLHSLVAQTAESGLMDS